MMKPDKFDEAFMSLRDITERAEAMKLGLAKYPVAEVRTMIERIGDIHAAFYRVRGLEWMGRRRGPGTSMGAQNGTIYPACPVCHGLEKPNGDFDNSAVGHQPGCWLGDLLKEDLL